MSMPCTGGKLGFAGAGGASAAMASASEIELGSSACTFEPADRLVPVPVPVPANAVLGVVVGVTEGGAFAGSAARPLLALSAALGDPSLLSTFSISARLDFSAFASDLFTSPLSLEPEPSAPLGS